MASLTTDSSNVSSLYGPGAVTCWLCALLSIIISWSYKSKNRSKDTITNDFIAALLLPAIAGIHLIYEVASHTVRIETFDSSGDDAINQAGTPTISATLVICETYIIAAPVLMALAVTWGNFKRFYSALLVTGISSSGMFLLMSQTTLYKDLRPLGFAYIWAVIFLLLLIFLLAAPFVDGVRQSLLSLLFQVVTSLDTPRPTVRAEYLWSIYFYLLAQATVRGLGRVSGSTTSGVLFLIPATPYSVHDLDQAVALAGGVITLLMSIHDACKVHYPWSSGGKRTSPLNYPRPENHRDMDLSMYARGGILHPDTVLDQESLLMKKMDIDPSTGRWNLRRD